MLMKSIEERESVPPEPTELFSPTKVKKRHLSATESEIQAHIHLLHNPTEPKDDSFLNLKPISTDILKPVQMSSSWSSSTGSFRIPIPNESPYDLGNLSKQFSLPESIPLFNTKQEGEYILSEVTLQSLFSYLFYYRFLDLRRLNLLLAIIIWLLRLKLS
jgi:hypothetical protein